MSNGICPPDYIPGILSDRQIRLLCVDDPAMIHPFVDHQVKENGVISYGLSSYGYDVRISNEFKIIKTDPYDIEDNRIIDPTELDESIFLDYMADEIIIQPHAFVLGKTMEVVDIPRDILVIALAKSTWARCGLVVGVTPLEPGFEGTVTLELSNTTDLPIRVKAGHGIHQFLFLKGSETCKISYADRRGKYMNQRDVTLPRNIK